MSISFDDLREYFHLDGAPLPLTQRYNIAPSQEVAVVRVEKGNRRLVTLRWGLIPFWADDPKIGYRTVNARAETAHKTPAFRSAFRKRRCIVPASGFFEWEHQEKEKQPFFIYRKDGAPLAFAGLWEHWEGEPKGEVQVIESCTILTTVATAPVTKLHNRMPVILEQTDFDRWLNPEERDLDVVLPLLRPTTKDALTMHPVSKYVNKAGNEGERCVEAVTKKCNQDMES